MDRSSGTDAPPATPSSEKLPLSASPPGRVAIVLEVERAGSTRREEIVVDSGTPIRRALREIGLAAEGCMVLDDGVAVPLDTRIDAPRRLTVLPVFSGG